MAHAHVTKLKIGVCLSKIIEQQTALLVSEKRLFLCAVQLDAIPAKKLLGQDVGNTLKRLYRVFQKRNSAPAIRISYSPALSL
jgi:hypothetical protein